MLWYKVYQHTPPVCLVRINTLEGKGAEFDCIFKRKKKVLCHWKCVLARSTDISGVCGNAEPQTPSQTDWVGICKSLVIYEHVEVFSVWYSTTQKGCYMFWKREQGNSCLMSRRSVWSHSITVCACARALAYVVPAPALDPTMCHWALLCARHCFEDWGYSKTTTTKLHNSEQNTDLMSLQLREDTWFNPPNNPAKWVRVSVLNQVVHMKF